MKNKLKSEQIIPLSFLIAIIVGTLLLMLPIATADGQGTDIVTALFTATTSICVTGLVVVDTFAYWSLFGKIVILIMIQLGGLGIITVTSVLMLMIQRKFSLSQSLMLHDAFNLNSMSGLIKFLGGVLKGTFVVEGLGALVYMIEFVPVYGPVGIWYSFFTAISAFCNAGIDILGPSSLVPYHSNTLVLVNTMVLIVLGGLGYVVWFDMMKSCVTGVRKKYNLKQIVKRFSEHTKTVLMLTLFLIILGSVAVFIMEYSNPKTLQFMSMKDKILNSIFQSITFRTAGFAAVPQQDLTDGTCLFGSLLMFIGGSPVGTAGGVKTMTFFLAMVNAVSFIRNRNENVIFGRKVRSDLMHKSAAIITVSFMITFVFMILLVCIDKVPVVDGMYEMFSATATVGLSRALTPRLSTCGRLLVIVAMYLGRIGPISMALFFNNGSSDRNNISYAPGQFFVG